MRKLFFLMAFLAVSATGMAQDVDNFEVGPYEVEYKEAGDYRFRLRKDVNLYDYYGLKKDTTIQVTEEPSKPVKGAFQLNAFLSLPRWVANGASNVFGIDGSWKQSIGRQLYFNAGLSLGLSFGKYGDHWDGYTKDWKNGDFTETIFEVGVPLSIEVGNVNYKKASMYGGLGVTPTFYAGGKNINSGSKSGILVAPRLDLGGYLPAGNRIVRIGGFAQYKINCSKGDFDIYAHRIGGFFLGGNIGLVF